MKKRFGGLVIAFGLCFALAIPAFADENSTGTLYANANTAANVSQNKSSSGNAPIYVRNGESTPTYTDSTIGLGGAKIIMFKGNESGQQISIVIESNDGQLIVVDGGLKTNAPYLSKYIKSKGGKVAAWLLTHPHEDHVGALSVILEQQKVAGHPDFYDIDPGQIYFSFAPYSYYEQYEQGYRLPMIKEVMDDLAAYPAEKKHENSERGTTFSYGNVSVEILNTAYSIPIDTGNNSSICYMITINGKKLLITGDLPYEAAGKLLEELPAEKLKADIVQMAHHGQQGVGRTVYEVVKPTICLWPTPIWLWENNNGGGLNSGNWRTLEVRGWMRQLGVKTHVVAKDGDQVLR